MQSLTSLNNLVLPAASMIRVLPIVFPTIG
jgi:hypothetical protein